MKPKIYLIPNILSDHPSAPAPGHEPLRQLRVFFVEEMKSARRLLRSLDPEFPLNECEFILLNEHTSPDETRQAVAPYAGQDIGVISEAGCPCVADPGADLVLLAHREGREIVPLVGPSSILLALMASGLNGQNFAFNGYLPKEHDARSRKIKALEARARGEGQTQIVMETPYRNQKLFDEFLAVLDPATLLCAAIDLTGPGQLVRTMSVKEWQSQKFDMAKQPALFLFGPDVKKS